MNCSVWPSPLGFAFLGSLLCTGLAGAQPLAYEVTADRLHVRTGPGSGYASRGFIQRGQAYALVEQRGVWGKIQIGNRLLWSSLTYMRRSSRPLVEVTASELNVRTGADTRYRILGRVPRGTLFVDQGRSGTWAQVSFHGTKAYVHANYIRQARTSGASGSTPVRTAPPPPPVQPSRPRSSAGFIQLPASGPGFESYTSASKRWGKPNLVYGVERAARRWQRERSDRIGVGDISLAPGGYFPGHSSHRDGRDVDLAPVRNDRRELPVTIYQAAYSRNATTRMLT